MNFTFSNWASNDIDASCSWGIRTKVVIIKRAKIISWALLQWLCDYGHQGSTSHSSPIGSSLCPKQQIWLILAKLNELCRLWSWQSQSSDHKRLDERTSDAFCSHDVLSGRTYMSRDLSTSPSTSNNGTEHYLEAIERTRNLMSSQDISYHWSYALTCVETLQDWSFHLCQYQEGFWRQLWQEGKKKRKKKKIENIRKSNIFMCCLENGWEQHPKLLSSMPCRGEIGMSPLSFSDEPLQLFCLERLCSLQHKKVQLLLFIWTYKINK